MQIIPIGAAREVTGSCFHITSKKTQVLVDCGIFQGSTFARSKNFEDFGFDPKQIDAVFVTHAHLDHTGRLPLLIKRGFKGKIYLTPPTLDLTRLVLEDSVEIMEMDHKRYYTPMLFTKKDVQQTLKYMHPISDNGAICFKDLQIQFHNAGHILGSAFIQITEQKGGTATFSGDLGNVNTPILMQKDNLNNTDALFIESTYGNRIHEDPEQRWIELKSAIIKTIKQDGVLLIPAFAIERTQELLFELNNLVENRLMPFVNIYLDSPMATEATDIFKKYKKYYSKKALHLIAQGDKLFDFPGLQITKTKDQSKTINQADWPKVIIAGAGMMNGGRILHHLIRYLGNKRCTVLIIGYQASGTLGRKLYNGEKRLKVLNEFIEVKTNVTSIGGYSAHADQNMLIDWIKSAKVLPKHIFCTHGEDEAAVALATRIKQDLNINAEAPRPGQIINI
ncbi:MBL fold metallo-hydrolase [Patescibacteria group bacterium]|nr:MBL fold metallo-hydrolase [Patescibacteria group bacterium]